MTNAPEKITAPALWLCFCAAMVMAMIVIGAITRLTESGLSMVEWRPLIGILPPLSEVEWERVFGLYRETPEFQMKNSWMELADFKGIFFWEWFHRFWGQVIGAVYLLPLLYFQFTKRLAGRALLAGWGLFALVCAQGVMGWYMVESGLVNEPNVSHYRLAVHLALAFTLLGLTVWQAMRFMGARRTGHFCLFRHGCFTLGFLAITILWGAFVAGLDAGLVYNEFPLMGDGFLPHAYNHLSPFWLNAFENISFVQFVHRWLGVSAMLLILFYAGRAIFWNSRKEPVFMLLVLMAGMQVGLGIATLLTSVYLPLAVFHQMGAAVLVILMTISLYRTRP